ncbi:hypothetical protein DBV15_07244 [Temnothorax longispinosus]|uniref:Uncharacterized protein n=1 Tax=Temnothorax longispinosus TaxID=300112 RepID=A0A4S2JJA7_9HYME|nr:hypothetical protein DBV15_07244 [Temnothorax longispinosus]
MPSKNRDPALAELLIAAQVGSSPICSPLGSASTDGNAIDHSHGARGTFVGFIHTRAAPVPVARHASVKGELSRGTGNPAWLDRDPQRASFRQGALYAVDVSYKAGLANGLGNGCEAFIESPKVYVDSYIVKDMNNSCVNGRQGAAGKEERGDYKKGPGGDGGTGGSRRTGKKASSHIYARRCARVFPVARARSLRRRIRIMTGGINALRIHKETRLRMLLWVRCDKTVIASLSSLRVLLINVSRAWDDSNFAIKRKPSESVTAHYVKSSTSLPDAKHFTISCYKTAMTAETGKKFCGTRVLSCRRKEPMSFHVLPPFAVPVGMIGVFDNVEPHLRNSASSTAVTAKTGLKGYVERSCRDVGRAFTKDAQQELARNARACSVGTYGNRIHKRKPPTPRRDAAKRSLSSLWTTEESRGTRYDLASASICNGRDRSASLIRVLIFEIPSDSSRLSRIFGVDRHPHSAKASIEGENSSCTIFIGLISRSSTLLDPSNSNGVIDTCDICGIVGSQNGHDFNLAYSLGARYPDHDWQNEGGRESLSDDTHYFIRSSVRFNYIFNLAQPYRNRSQKYHSLLDKGSKAARVNRNHGRGSVKNEILAVRAQSGGAKEGGKMGRTGAGRAEKSARNAAQLSRSYSKLAYRLTSFRLGCVVVDDVLCLPRPERRRVIKNAVKGTREELSRSSEALSRLEKRRRTREPEKAWLVPRSLGTPSPSGLIRPALTFGLIHKYLINNRPDNQPLFTALFRADAADDEEQNARPDPFCCHVFPYHLWIRNPLTVLRKFPQNAFRNVASLNGTIISNRVHHQAAKSPSRLNFRFVSAGRGSDYYCCRLGDVILRGDLERTGLKSRSHAIDSAYIEMKLLAVRREQHHRAPLLDHDSGSIDGPYHCPI